MEIKEINYDDLTLRQVSNSSDKLIIFSHGFGVQWDARGMFLEIAENLGKEFDYIFFDYNRVDENGNTYVESVDEQITIFRKIYEFAANQNYKQINVLTHSFGVVAPLVHNPSNVNKLIMLAPPTEIDREKQENMLKNRPGSKFKSEGYSTFVRSNGQKTFVNATFYKSLDGLKAVDLMNNCVAHHKDIIVALEDEIVSNEILNSSDKIKNVSVSKIHGDHNFTGESRAILNTKIKEILEN